MRANLRRRETPMRLTILSQTTSDTSTEALTRSCRATTRPTDEPRTQAFLRQPNRRCQRLELNFDECCRDRREASLPSEPESSKVSSRCPDRATTARFRLLAVALEFMN